MKTTVLLLTALGLAGSGVVLAQTQPPTEGPGVQASRDAREPSVLATCKNPPPPPRPFVPPREVKIPEKYHVDAIPDVVAAGAQWKLVWQIKGNGADGIIGLKNGDILVPETIKSDVVEVTPAGRAHGVYQDTDTGGGVSMNKQGELFVVERGLRASIWELAPEHRVLANRLQNGDSFDCLTNLVLNDLAAPAFGGVYFTQGGLYYAAPNGIVTQYGTHLQTNGIVLSPDEKTLYVTNAGTLVAFDVQSDGSLSNQHVLAKIPGGGGDGSTVDAQGRIYVTGYPGVRVIGAGGMVLGTIPAPMRLVSVTFGGKGKKTLYVLGEKRGPKGVDAVQLLAIPTIAQGYIDRPK